TDRGVSIGKELPAAEGTQAERDLADFAGRNGRYRRACVNLPARSVSKASSLTLRACFVKNPLHDVAGVEVLRNPGTPKPGFRSTSPPATPRFLNKALRAGMGVGKAASESRAPRGLTARQERRPGGGSPRAGHTRSPAKPCPSRSGCGW